MAKKYKKHPKIRIIETGEEFTSFNKAAMSIGGNRGCVYLCLKGMRSKHKGYSFEFVDGRTERIDIFEKI